MEDQSWLFILGMQYNEDVEMMRIGVGKKGTSRDLNQFLVMNSSPVILNASWKIGHDWLFEIEEK